MAPSTKRRKLTSEVWKYFVPNDERSAATCKLCIPATEFKTTGCSTSVLRRHLHSRHEIEIKSNDKCEGDDSQEWLELISKMAACDGIPFSTLASSPSFEKLFHLAGFTGIPRSGNGVRNVIMKYYNSKRNVVAGSLKAHVINGQKFSITLDEWTSTANRRYMNVNLHSVKGMFWNLGLVRIYGSATSEACNDYIQTKLREFGISFSKDIFCLTTDGAAVMKKLGRISKKKQQLCMAHGIHLSVMEVIYQRGTLTETTVEESDEESYEETEESGFELEKSVIPLDLNSNLGEIVNKIRKIVKFFRVSPLKEEALQVYTNAAHGKDIALVLDVRIRWNSLLLMMERFVKLKIEVQKALIDMNEPYHVTEDEFLFIEEIIRILTPVKMAVEAICMHDASLLSCDVALHFMMAKLTRKRLQNSMRLYETLKKRIAERRTYLSDVVNYIRFRKLPTPTDYIQVTSKYQLGRVIRELADDIFETQVPNSQESDNVYMENSETFTTDLTDGQELTLEMELYNAIKLVNEDGGGPTKNILKQEKSIQATIKKRWLYSKTEGYEGDIWRGCIKL